MQEYDDYEYIYDDYDDYDDDYDYDIEYDDDDEPVPFSIVAKFKYLLDRVIAKLNPPPQDMDDIPF